MKYQEITDVMTEQTERPAANIEARVERKRQRSAGLAKSDKRRSQVRLEKLKRQYDSPAIQTKSESPLFADFLRDWLKITAPTIERTTHYSYESLIDARLDPFFRERGLRLNEIEPRHIRELHESIFKDGCTANTVIHYHALVRKALQYAVKNELILENAADKVDRPKKGKYLAGFYSKDELSLLFEITKGDSMSVVIQLAAYYGLRRSEVLGIRWSAIDFKRGSISINHKVTESKEPGIHRLYTEDKLKTKSSFRTLPLIPAVRELLLAHRKKQAYCRSKYKDSYCTDYLGYVCVDEKGRLFRPTYITDHFKLLLQRHSLRPIRFHDLRHSCATILLSQGIPMKQIQDWLGHSTFSTTADIYSHLDYNSKLDSAAAIAAVFESEPDDLDDF